MERKSIDHHIGRGNLKKSVELLANEIERLHARIDHLENGSPVAAEPVHKPVKVTPVEFLGELKEKLETDIAALEAAVEDSSVAKVIEEVVEAVEVAVEVLEGKANLADAEEPAEPVTSPKRKK